MVRDRVLVGLFKGRPNCHGFISKHSVDGADYSPPPPHFPSHPYQESGGVFAFGFIVVCYFPQCCNELLRNIQHRPFSTSKEDISTHLRIVVAAIDKTRPTVGREASNL